jgi:hypothetical protein
MFLLIEIQKLKTEYFPELLLALILEYYHFLLCLQNYSLKYVSVACYYVFCNFYLGFTP